MKTKSVLEYDDVILSLNYVEKRGEKRGEKIGEKRGEKKGEKRGEKKGEKKAQIKLVQNCHKYNMTIEQIAALTGLTKKEVSDILLKL
jgi:predicted transposase/invertase (TIGR01784 family)